MPKLPGGSPSRSMEPNKMTKVVTFYNGETFKLPTNWQAMLSGYENHIVFKKFPPKTKLHPNPPTKEEKEDALGKKMFVIDNPTVMVDYYTSDDSGQAYDSIVDGISGIYPRIKEAKTEEKLREINQGRSGDILFQLSPDNKEVRGDDIPGAVKCAVHAMDYFTKNSPRVFDKKLVMNRMNDQLKACLVSESTAIKFTIDIPERWKE